MNSKELVERKGKKATLSLYNDAKYLLERLPDKLSMGVWTASMRDFLWGVVDQFDHIAALDARIEALEGANSKLRRCLSPIQMGFAQAECIDEPIPDDAVVISFMGSGASDHVTAGEIRAALGGEHGG